MENRAANMNEEWIRLEQYNIPHGEFIVTKFIQDEDGTKIKLDNEVIEVEIYFDGVPLLVRNSVSNLRMRTWSEVQLKYSKTIFRNDFFFEVKNSLLVDWAVEEGCGFYEKEKIRHYCIITSLDIMDILAEFEPMVKVSPMSG